MAEDVHVRPTTFVLNGWKEIANHLGRGVRTAQRWEELGLPIRRPRGTDRSAVLAVTEEVDSWVKKCAAHHEFNMQALHALRERCRQNCELAQQLRERAAQSCARAESLRAQICAQASRINAAVAFAKGQYKAGRTM